jgi:hypothetical protein
MTRAEIEELIYGKPEQQRRFTQDFPILPDVWIAYAELPTKRQEAIKQNKTPPSERIELLLTPHTRSDAASLARALRRRWEDEWDNEKGQIARYRAKHPPKDLDFNKMPRILFNEAVVFADFTFEELLRVAMPLTDWWKNNVAKPLSGWWKAMDISAPPAVQWTREDIQRFVQELQQGKTAIEDAETKSKLGGDHGRKTNPFSRKTNPSHRNWSRPLWIYSRDLRRLRNPVACSMASARIAQPTPAYGAPAWQSKRMPRPAYSMWILREYAGPSST